MIARRGGMWTCKPDHPGIRHQRSGPNRVRRYPLPMERARRVIVTGGAGFIGSHLVDRLLGSGSDVVVIDDLSGGSEAHLPAGVPLTRIDLAAPGAAAAIANAHPDAVVHCAAQTSVPASFDDPVRDAQSNIIGSLNVIDGCRRAGAAHFVYVTTGGALYGRPMSVAWDEQASITPISPYGISKWTVESYMKILAAAPRVTVLRLANVYGPRQGACGESGVVATFIGRMQAGLPVVIDGDGEQTRDLLYVADAVDAIQAALNSGSARSFNIGTGSGTSVNTLFRELAALTGYTRPPDPGPARAGDIRHSALDPTLAGRLLGWRPRTPLTSGLAKTVESWAPTRHEGRPA
jgi:UDP-glucose 4-epimerase